MPPHLIQRRYPNANKSDNDITNSNVNTKHNHCNNNNPLEDNCHHSNPTSNEKKVSVSEESYSSIKPEQLSQILKIIQQKKMSGPVDIRTITALKQAEKKLIQMQSAQQ
ncbi:hypothetical protein RFI_18067 [Reticulomyxa filosa]|uniref:Uncharacterized protein n=1 Tax=Reticulomyxa filosa TaxID=46433 RepID=X6N1G7_RETFI|nr:hypothetical protein RFI_18067 [Reticulomyxa filosa]|eukprot:ETO19167.1 hypothetical protein RFI_18067 [Reticulomyxa filosa]